MLVCLSTPAEEFDETGFIASHDDLAAFLGKLRTIMPPFPMLEDFVPEADWGEVRVRGIAGFEPIFYGGSVERIPDFIEAFRMLTADDRQAETDMNLAVAIQRSLIESISSSQVGSAEAIRPGHWETPSADFWSVCRQVLPSVQPKVQALISDASTWTTAELGALGLPNSLSAFADIVMSKTALPLLFVRASGLQIPVAPRAATSTVLDLWSERAELSDAGALSTLGRRISGYLSKRFRPHDVIPGPIRIVGTSGRFDFRLAAVLQSGDGFQFVLPIAEGDLPRLGRIERWIRSVVDDSDRWGLMLEDTRQIAELRNASGDLARSDRIDLLVVLARVSTQPSFLRVPECDAHVMGLPDFVSLFDSLKDGAELKRFWRYLDGTASLTGGLVGLVDHFAAFRDSHALLAPGAEEPTFIGLDPHWNSSWRFKELREFWANAPSRFPDDQCQWNVDASESDITCLKSKGPLMLAWSGSVGGCTFQAAMEINETDIDFDNGPLLELFVQCVVDALTRRGNLLIGLALFQRPQIVLWCDIDRDLLPIRDDEVETTTRAAQPLLTGWIRLGAGTHGKLDVAVQVNVARLLTRIEDAKDASFEAECATAVVECLSALLDLP